MFQHEKFTIDDPNEIFDFLENNAFGQLISNHNGQLEVTHMPLNIDRKNSLLSGHFARANSQWKDLENQKVLVTFLGPHDYISPNWYKNPGVPTWNYQAVHVYGQCTVIDEEHAKAEIVNRLTSSYESRFQNPWQADYSISMLRGIVGFEMRITDIQCKFKLSQNKTVEDRQGAIDALQEIGSLALADAMKKHSTNNN